jgi:hypothetical protein
MDNKPVWVTMRANARAEAAGVRGMSAIRMALLFGSAAVALAVIAAPIADRHVKERVIANALPLSVDPVTTGSVRSGKGTYTVRRSILQDSPSAVCIIAADGSRRGSC